MMIQIPEIEKIISGMDSEQKNLIEIGEFGDPIEKNDQILNIKMDDDLRELWILVKKLKFVTMKNSIPILMEACFQSVEKMDKTKAFRAWCQRDWAEGLSKIFFAAVLHRYNLWEEYLNKW